MDVYYKCSSQSIESNQKSDTSKCIAVEFPYRAKSVSSSLPDYVEDCNVGRFYAPTCTPSELGYLNNIMHLDSLRCIKEWLAIANEWCATHNCVIPVVLYNSRPVTDYMQNNMMSDTAKLLNELLLKYPNVAIEIENRNPLAFDSYAWRTAAVVRELANYNATLNGRISMSLGVEDLIKQNRLRQICCSYSGIESAPERISEVVRDFDGCVSNFSVSTCLGVGLTLDESGLPLHDYELLSEIFDACRKDDICRDVTFTDKDAQLNYLSRNEQLHMFNV